MSDEQSLTDVVHNSGPYSAVNRVSARGKQPYLKPETMRALWSPVIKMNSPESLNQVIQFESFILFIWITACYKNCGKLKLDIVECAL
jgi:hypothetical protein